MGFLAGGLLLGNAIATSIDKPFDNDHFVYLEYKKTDGSSASYGLVVGRTSVPLVLKELQDAFGKCLQIPLFSEKAEEIDNNSFLRTRAVSATSTPTGSTRCPSCVPTKRW
jgi:hypothetical protein